MPQDTGRKLNEYKTYSRPPGCLLNVLCTFNLRPVSRGYYQKNISFSDSIGHFDFYAISPWVYTKNSSRKVSKKYPTL